MSATTDIQLGGAKKRASSTPGGMAKKATAELSGAGERGVVAGNAVRSASGRFVSSGTACKKPRTSVSQAKVRSEEWPLELTAKQNEATALFEENEGADGKSSKGAGNAVKAHTEAGKKRLVNLLLGLAATQATEGGFKITPADLIRLMQLHKELNPQKDRKVTVQWIEDRPE